MFKFALSTLLFLATVPAFSQLKYENDTKTIESTVKACLETISVKKGEPVDWDRFENLYLPSATLGVTFVKSDTTHYRDWKPSDFKRITQYSKTGFHEYQLGIQVQEFGDIAQVFQTFGCRYADDQPEVSRGINAFQLVFKEGRWWVSSMIWAQETPELKLPEHFLDKK